MVFPQQVAESAVLMPTGAKDNLGTPRVEQSCIYLAIMTGERSRKWGFALRKSG